MFPNRWNDWQKRKGGVEGKIEDAGLLCLGIATSKHKNGPALYLLSNQYPANSLEDTRRGQGHGLLLFFLPTPQMIIYWNKYLEGWSNAILKLLKSVAIAKPCKNEECYELFF